MKKKGKKKYNGNGSTAQRSRKAKREMGITPASSSHPKCPFTGHNASPLFSSLSVLSRSLFFGSLILSLSLHFSTPTHYAKRTDENTDKNTQSILDKFVQFCQTATVRKGRKGEEGGQMVWSAKTKSENREILGD